MMPEGLDDLVRLVRPHQTMVDQNRMHAIAERLSQENRRHGGVDAARERADDRAAAGLPADLLDLLFPKGRHRPFGHDSADSEDEVLEDLGAMLRVPDFRMELDRVEASRAVLESGDRVGGGGADDPGSRRRSLDRVAVVHPDRLLFFQAREERRVDRDPRDRATVLPAVVGDLSPQRLRKPLHPVAEAEGRHPERERIGRRARSIRLVDALRPARKDEARRIPLANFGFSGRGREHDGEHARVPDPPRDQLRVLAAEVQDDDAAGCRIHTVPARLSRARGPARSAATGKATTAAPKGAAATKTGATRAPGATRAAVFSPTTTRTPVETRRRPAYARPKARR